MLKKLEELIEINSGEFKEMAKRFKEVNSDSYDKFRRELFARFKKEIPDFSFNNRVYTSWFSVQLLLEHNKKLLAVLPEYVTRDVITFVNKAKHRGFVESIKPLEGWRAPNVDPYVFTDINDAFKSMSENNFRKEYECRFELNDKLLTGVSDFDSKLLRHKSGIDDRTAHLARFYGMSEEMIADRMMYIGSVLKNPRSELSLEATKGIKRGEMQVIVSGRQCGKSISRVVYDEVFNNLKESKMNVNINAGASNLNTRSINTNSGKVFTMQPMIYGRYAEEFSNEAIFQIISDLEDEVGKKNAIQNRPKALDKAVKELNKSIKELIEYVDNRK